VHLLPQVLALDLVLDALRDADVRILGEIDQQPPGDRRLRGKPRALAADGVLHDLHQQRLPFGEDLLDGALRLAVGRTRRPDVGDVEERRARQPDLDEGRLHSREHAAHAAQIDVADQPAAGRALDVQLLHRALLGHRHPRFLRRDVDEDLLVHRRRRAKAVHADVRRCHADEAR